MTPAQIELARHALGLPNEWKQSYRNRFYVASSDNAAYAAWCEMVKAGHARGKADGRMTCFWMLEAGARLALEDGESLDPEDFPAGAA